MTRRSGLSRANRSGAAAVEFALVAPILIFLLWGIVSYGGYFLAAHGVQQIANDAARASIAGLDFEERQALAEDCVAKEAPAYPLFAKTPLSVAVAAQGDWLSVRVSFNGEHHPIWAFAMLGPMPSPQVTRSGMVLLGGY